MNIKKIILIPLLLLIKVNYAQSNAIIPNSLINATHITSIPQALSFSFAFAFFGIGIVLLVFGIVYGRTKKMRLALNGAFIMSLVLYFISNNLINVAIPLILGIFVVATITLDLWTHHKKGSNT